MEGVAPKISLGDYRLRMDVLPDLQCRIAVQWLEKSLRLPLLLLVLVVLLLPVRGTYFTAWP